MTIKGFSSDKMIGSVGAGYATIVPVGSDKKALDVAPKALFELSAIPVSPVRSYLRVSKSGERTSQIIEITAHGMKEGDVLRFVSGPLVNIEAVVIAVLNANELELGTMLPQEASTSTALKMRHITLTLSPSGALVVSSGPSEYILDGVATQVLEDTVDPSNNRPMPSKSFVDIDGVNTPVSIDTADYRNDITSPSMMYYVKDGEVTRITRDTVTPANTRPIPVELVDITGVPANINVTTGDIGIEISHDGVSHTWDSTRIGDGTNLMGVNADLEALVHDLDTHTRLDTLNAKDFATSAKQDTLQTKVDTLATEAKQDAIITELQAIKTQALDTVEDFYKRDFVSSPLTVASGWVTLRTLTAAIKKISVINNSGNELLIRNQTTNKSIIVGQGAAFDSSLIGAIADVIELQAFGADAVDGIIYINFEG